MDAASANVKRLETIEPEPVFAAAQGRRFTPRVAIEDTLTMTHGGV
jgi:hypothetical protein